MAHDSDSFDSTEDADKRFLLELLYGETSPKGEAAAREARRDDALEGELESMRGLRALFAELPDEEPPPALTAQLMHAAAMHAKKAPAASAAEKESLFARLAGWFAPLLAHPGLAAAASLVVVAGVAGSLYLRGEAKVVQPQVASEASAPADDERAAPGGRQGAAPRAPAAEPVVPAAAAPAADQPMLGGAEQVADGLLEQEAKRDDKASRKSLATTGKNEATGSGAGYGTRGGLLSEDPAIGSTGSRGRSAGAGATEGSADRWAAPPPPPKASGVSKGKATTTIAVDLTDEPMPLEASAAEDDGDSAPEEKPASKSASAPAKKLSPQAPTAPAAPAPSPDDNRDGDVRALHGRAVDAAGRGDCTAVLRFAGEIRTLDGAYYDKAFRTDKRLASCLNPPSAPAKK